MAVTGFVDGIINGELRGWIANLHEPRKLEQVRCIGENGKTRDFAPLHYRRDVCDHLSVKGTFGFAIAEGSLADLGSRVCVCSCDDTPLENGLHVQTSGVPSDNSGTANLRVFIHIQKTSGTSLRNDLLSRSPLSGTMSVYPNPEGGIPDNQIEQVPQHQIDTLKLVYGHVRFGIHARLKRSARYVTVFRDPYDRLRSQFWHLCRTHAETRLPYEPHVIVNERMSDEFDNLMTRCVAGVDISDVPIGRVDHNVLELALNNIESWFDYIGLVEDPIDLQHKTLALLSGMQSNRSYANMSGPRTHEASVQGLMVDWVKLLQANHYDLLLYRKVFLLRSLLFRKTLRI